MNRAVVTGATGYIGSNLVRALCKLGVGVAIICRKTSDLSLLEDCKDNIEIYRYDDSGDDIIINLTNFFASFQPDVVFHLASCFVSEHQPYQVDDLVDSNIKFPTQLLEAMSGVGIRCLVNASTAWQNYNNEEYNPVCLYAATKEAFEDIIKYYTEVKGIDVISLAIFDSYGPNDPRKKLIHLLNRIAASGETLDMSAGEQELDMVYIDDIVSDFIQAAEMLINGESHEDKYYIRSGQVITLRKLVDIFEDVYGVKLNINWGARPYRKREVMTLARRGHVLDENCNRVQLREGLERIINQEDVDK